MALPRASAKFEAKDCTVTITQVREGCALVTLEGSDRGELGREPFAELERSFSATHRLTLFIDLEAAVGASLDVSGSWAVWLRANRQNLEGVNMLTGSYFVELSAQTVKRFSDLGEKVRLFTDRAAFEAALQASAGA
jgi:hypothetical protein